MSVTGQNNVDKSLRLVAAGRTHTGRLRQLNEDAWQIAPEADTAHLWAPRGQLFAVADGMGGHAAGEVASQLAIDTLMELYYGDVEASSVPAIRLEQAISIANHRIYEQAAAVDSQAGMGTTLVAAVVREDQLTIANVGDSRAYLVRDGEAIQITRDHSWVAEQVNAGTLTEEQAQNHALRNIVTRSLGHRPAIPVDIFRQPLEPGDAVLLCSDGLSNQVSNAEIARAVTECSPDQATEQLIELANQNGGPDNITALVIKLVEAEPLQPVPEAPAAAPQQGVQDAAASPIAAERTSAARPWRVRSAQRSAPPGRRRVRVVLTVITLVALVAIALLVAWRAGQIGDWLTWPTPGATLAATPTRPPMATPTPIPASEDISLALGLARTRCPEKA